MKRDFSDSAYNELISLVGQVESEKWCDFTDWFGDRWYDFEEWIGALNIGSSIDNVNSYHKKVIDKNNASKDTIDGIFADVKNIDQNYATRFAAYKTLVDEFTGLVEQFSGVVSPANGSFSADKFEPGALKDSISSYEDVEKYLKLIGGDGLSEEDLPDDMDEVTMSKITNGIVSSLIDLFPDVKVGQKVEIPIGPNLSIYYSVEAEVDGNTDIDLNLIVEDQRLKLKSVSYSTGGELSFGVEGTAEGDVGFSLKSGNIKTSLNILDGVGASTSLKVGNDTYTVTVKSSIVGTVGFEESVKTDIDGGAVTSAIGFKRSSVNNWTPLPVPEKVEEPSAVKLPKLEVPDWVYVAGSVVIIGVAIALAPETGGLSLALCGV